eukprot:1082516-Rhodomonas_salina.2
MRRGSGPRTLTSGLRSGGSARAPRLQVSLPRARAARRQGGVVPACVWSPDRVCCALVLGE